MGLEPSLGYYLAFSAQETSAWLLGLRCWDDFNCTHECARLGQVPTAEYLLQGTDIRQPWVSNDLKTAESRVVQGILQTCNRTLLVLTSRHF